MTTANNSQGPLSVTCVFTLSPELRLSQNIIHRNQCVAFSNGFFMGSYVFFSRVVSGCVALFFVPERSALSPHLGFPSPSLAAAIDRDNADGPHFLSLRNGHVEPIRQSPPPSHGQGSNKAFLKELHETGCWPAESAATGVHSGTPSSPCPHQSSSIALE